MKEVNKDKLIEGLQNLPNYKAPDSVWEGISNKLNQDPVLAEALSKLPIYTAPDGVWDAIEGELHKPVKRINLNFISRMAAALLFLVVALAAIQNVLKSSNDPLAKLDVQIREEKVDEKLLAQLQHDDNLEFEQVLKLCDNMEFICTRPRVSKLKADLLELNNAKQQLKQALGEYGTEVYLINQLKAIEFEQTRLIKQLTHFLT